MKLYSADFGTWDCGTTEQFYAEDDDEAIETALKMSTDPMPLVVVRRSPNHPGPVIWDQMNGPYGEHQ